MKWVARGLALPMDIIIVSGEAILSAENSGKPLGGPNPAAGAQHSPDPLTGGMGIDAPSRTPPALSAFGLDFRSFGL